MKCPVCPEAQLVMSDRNGIEIDYCPQCRGVWLDRGELDKIIDRSQAAAPVETPMQMPPAAPPQSQPPQYGFASEVPRAPQPRESSYRRDDRYRDDDDDDDDDRRHKKKKRGGFLGDLFDFD